MLETMIELLQTIRIHSGCVGPKPKYELSRFTYLWLGPLNKYNTCRLETAMDGLC